MAALSAETANRGCTQRGVVGRGEWYWMRIAPAKIQTSLSYLDKLLNICENIEKLDPINRGF